MSVFDSVNGLPLHVLVVHAVVVGVPLMALVTIVVTARPTFRAKVGWPVVVLNAGLLAVTWVATQSGEALEARVGEAVVEEHSALGDRLPFFVLGLLVASLVGALARMRQRLGALSFVLALVAGVAAAWWTYRVGDSGAQAVWGGIIESTNP